MQSIQIAGTNGKGSTATYLASILSCSHRTGLYTSPHIRFFEERFVMDGHVIDDATLSKLLDQERDENAHLFMIWTRMAKRWMEEAGAEYAVVETGLGGAKDPTLIFGADMEILTPISLDHTEILGDTVAKIAGEKAGIIRENSRVLCAPQAPEALAVIEEAAARQHASLTLLRPQDVAVTDVSLAGQTFSIRRPEFSLHDLHISALSPSQPENAALAALAAHALGISDADIRTGLARTTVHGRVDYYPEGIIADGGHNKAALLELENTLRKHFPERRFTVLFALMKEKDAAAAAQIIERISDDIYLTCADADRGFPPAELAEFFSKPVYLIDDPHVAFREAWQASRREGNMLLICGSFYLLGEVAPQLEEVLQQRLASTVW